MVQALVGVVGGSRAKAFRLSVVSMICFMLLLYVKRIAQLERMEHVLLSSSSKHAV